MNELKNRLIELFETANPHEDLFLLDVELTASSPLQVAFTLDGDAGVTIGQCAEISRMLGNLIEEQDLIKTEYELEVSSPGADAPLKLLRQYTQHVGRKLAFTLQDGSTKKGKLLEIKQQDDKTLLNIMQEYEVVEGKSKKPKTKYQPLLLDFADIKTANVEISFK
jgi:ribosome maturation factor RimP